MSNTQQQNYAATTFNRINGQTEIKYVNNRMVLGKYNILYLNINSLNNKLDQLEIYVGEWNNKFRNKFIHLIALTEIHLNENDTKFFNIPNYNVFFSTRNSRLGGCALFAHKTLLCNLESKISNSNIEMLRVKILNLGISIMVIYKQPKSLNNIEFIEMLNRRPN